jgi:hypothetical protein
MAQFDAGSLKRRLRAAGATEPLADAIADGIREAVSPLATREDLEKALHAQTWRIVTFVVAFGGAAVAIILAFN